MQKRCFCDTNVLMDYSQEILEFYDKVFISGYVLGELDKHKSQSIDLTRQFKARETGRNLEKYKDKVEYIIRSGSFSLPLEFSDEGIDNKILQVFKDFYINNTDVVGLSNDLLFREKCKFLKLPCEKFEGLNTEKYMGYKTIEMTEDELAKWYEDKEKKNNYWNLNINEYLLLKVNNDIIDKYRWTSSGFKIVAKKDFKSVMFGSLKPKDVYQEICIDSLHNNQFTVITGKQGSGKSLCSLMYIMWAIANQKYDSCVIMYNPTKVRGAVDMGFCGGNVLEKGMQQFIGNMLISKFGDKDTVMDLINKNTLRLVPMSDSRGMEIANNQILYITEAQNTTSDLLKIALSRCSKESKIIIEGDPYQQVDKEIFVGKNNGLLKAIEVFKGEDMFGCVHLPNIHRSKIADIADKM